MASSSGINKGLLKNVVTPSDGVDTRLGTARSIEPEGLRTLIQEHEKALESALHNIAKQEQYQSEYRGLANTFRGLSEKFRQEALVPLGPLVMAKGNLIHTNEITCHIGDNWFVECNSKTAEKIAAHRIQKSQEMLVKFQKEKELISSWISETKRQLAESQSEEGTVEIAEVYDEEQEQQWRKQHRENVKNYYQKIAKEKQEQEASQKNSVALEDQELWDRLDMLEMEEELSEYENTKKSSQASKDTKLPSKSTSVSVDSASAPPEKSILKPTSHSSAKTMEALDVPLPENAQKRRVSFDDSKDSIHFYPAERRVPEISSPVAELDPPDTEVVEGFKGLVIEKEYSPESAAAMVHVPEVPEEIVEEGPEKPPQRMSLFKQRRMMEQQK